MPSKPTKSILKQSHPKSTSKVGSSRSANPSAEAGPSTLNRNTKLNSGSKFSKKVNVERATISRPSKRRLVEEDEEEEDSEDGEDDFPQDEGEGEGEDVDMDGEDSGLDTDEEIARGMNSKDGSSKKSTKRKRAATTAETFGSTLTALLSESTKKPKKASTAATTTESIEPESKGAKAQPAIKTKTPTAKEAILSLSQAKPPPSRNSENLERKAKRHLQALKEEKEDKARIRNVVEGWAATTLETPSGQVVVGGQEFEKSLRKTAQRGVIKLFNAILVAAKNAEEATTSLSAKAGVKDERGKGKKEKDNIMGRGGKEGVLTQESFLDMVRKG